MEDGSDGTGCRMLGLDTQQEKGTSLKFHCTLLVNQDGKTSG